jgi:hypothetical protein
MSISVNQALILRFKLKKPSNSKRQPAGITVSVSQIDWWITIWAEVKWQKFTSPRALARASIPPQPQSREQWVMQCHSGGHWSSSFPHSVHRFSSLRSIIIQGNFSRISSSFLCWILDSMARTFSISRSSTTTRPLQWTSRAGRLSVSITRSLPVRLFRPALIGWLRETPVSWVASTRCRVVSFGDRSWVAWTM